MTLVLVSQALAGTYQLCAATESSASTNGRWQVLTEGDQDGRTDLRRGTTNSAAGVSARYGERREVDLCSGADRMGGITLRGTTQMIEVRPGTCTAAVAAEGEGTAQGAGYASSREIRGGASGEAWARGLVENAASIGVDAGGGGTFDGEWSWRVSGPNARLAGFVEVTALEAYAGASLNVPGLAYVEAWDGMVDAWVRQGDRYVRYTGAAPVRLEIDTVVGGRVGRVCAGGSATAGVRVADDEAAGASGIDFALTPSATRDAPDRVTGEAPEFLECGCGSGGV